MPDIRSLSDAELDSLLGQTTKPVGQLSDAELDQHLAALEQPKGVVANAVAPIANYPGAYAEMNRESREQIGRGIEQVKSGINFATTPTPEGMSPSEQAGAGPVSLAKGVGNIALGGLSYVTSPINAALRTVVGQPIENISGVPKEYSEFAAGVVLPIPKKIPQLPTRAPKTLSTEELFAKSDAGYDSARRAGLAIESGTAGQVARNIKGDLTRKYDPEMIPETYGILGREAARRAPNEPGAMAAITGVQPAPKSPVGVNEIQVFRDKLRDAASSPVKRERDAATTAIRALDDFTAPLAPELAAARGDFSAASKARQIEEMVDRAANAKKPHDALVNQFRAILNNPKQRRLWSEDAIDKMEDIVRNGRLGQALLTAGRLAGGRGDMYTVVSGLVTGGVGPVLGVGLNRIGVALTEKKVAKLGEAIRSTAPSSKAASASLRDWTEARLAFEAAPSTKTFVRLSIASRNLSNNLKPIGVEVAPDNLIRLQGPMKAPAEDEQPEPEGVLNQ